MNIDKLLQVLKNGDLAIIPTDTVYGLIGDATNICTIKKIYDAKKRDYSKPLVILVSSLSMLKEYITELQPLERKIIDEFWPGPLTIIFKKNKKLSNLLTANTDEIAIRMPDNQDLLNLITRFNKPIIATSANISNENVITNINMLEDDLKNKVSYIYDGGDMTDIASTIIKVNNDKIIFLREGVIAPQIQDKIK